MEPLYNPKKNDDSSITPSSPQNNPRPWEVGYKILNRYEILDIKKGGMGVVYIVHDHEGNHKFALKTFQDQFLWNEKIIERFMAEAETWVYLGRHSNIVHAHSMQVIEGKPFLFLEYIESGDLNRRIGRMEIPKAVDFAIQFCTGMEYAYRELGVIHRDIKPGNVLVEKNPRFIYGDCYKVTDFGLVKALGSEFEGKSVEVSTGLGTSSFMPPEQYPETIRKMFSCTGSVTTRSDIYSFGVTLYFLLTGKLPFNDLNRIFMQNPPRPKVLNPVIPDQLDALIVRCMDKDQNRRYATFIDLRKELAGIFLQYTGEQYQNAGGVEEPGDFARKGDVFSFVSPDWNNKGVALLNLGKGAEAIECFEKVLRINPMDAGAWNNKGNALISLGKFAEAIECYDKTLQLTPGDARILTNKGYAFFKMGKLSEAAECYDKALGIDPRYADAWTGKAATCHRMDQFPKALECYDRALEINPRDLNAWYNKGRAHSSLKKFAEAGECYDKALGVDPRFADVWAGKGEALASLGKLEKAIECYDKTLQLNPGDAITWTNKGSVLGNLGNHTEAIRSFEKALMLNPNDTEARYNIGNQYAAMGQFSQAVVWYDKALVFNPQDFRAWNNKGLALASLGKCPEAIACYDRVLQINPGDTKAWSNKGAAQNTLKNYPEALKCSEKALQLNPSSAQAWGNKGVTLANMGRIQDAIVCFEKTISLLPHGDQAEIQQVQQIIRQLRGR